MAGAQIVAHEEPILVIGIPRDALAAYVQPSRASISAQVPGSSKPVL